MAHIKFLRSKSKLCGFKIKYSNFYSILDIAQKGKIRSFNGRKIQVTWIEKEFTRSKTTSILDFKKNFHSKILYIPFPNGIYGIFYYNPCDFQLYLRLYCGWFKLIFFKSC
jgi:hypothetical protein